MSSPPRPEVHQSGTPGSLPAVKKQSKAKQASGSKSGMEALAFEDYVIDSRGDLWVSAYGTGSWGPPTPLRFKVCSRALARSSSMFEKMLYGVFAEAKSKFDAQPGKEWEIELPECPPLATKQLFEIMHCKFIALQTDDGTKGTPQVEARQPQGDGTDSDEPPASSNKSFIGHRPITLRQLYDLVIVADYCDSLAILRPWVDSWIKAMNAKETTQGAIMRSAWVFFKLGLEDRYEEAVTQLAIEFPRLSQTESSRRKLPEVIPADFTDAVESLRRQASDALLKTVHHNIDALVSTGSVPLGLCKRYEHTLAQGNTRHHILALNETLDCEARILGYLQRELHKHQLWPLPKTEDLAISPSALHETLKSIGKRREYNKTHNDCVLELEPAGPDEGSTGGFADYKYTASQTEEAYMARQRVLMGTTVGFVSTLEKLRKCVALWDR
ncbi:BTB/POZ domain-containing protein 3/6 [Microdochium nivale]|nr:BTB/POZ domain-containing protein 3/6 [Microdochium nivale]